MIVELSLAAYLGFLVVIAIIIANKQSLEDYLLAERNLSGWTSAASILASKIGGGTLLVYTAYVYIYGISAFTFFLGALMGYCLFLVLAKKIKKIADEKRFYTLFDLIQFQFGKSGSMILKLFFISINLLNLVIQIIGGGKIISLIFEIPYTWSIFIMMSIILLYVSIGGFRSIVITDVVQVIMFVIILCFIGIIFAQQPIANIQFDVFEPTLLVAFFLLGIFLPFGSHDLWQRVFATKAKSLSKSLWIAIVGYLIVGTILTTLGILIKGILPNINPDLAIIASFQYELSGIAQAMGILALFAIIMSSADTWLFNCLTIFLQDILAIKHEKKSYVLTTIGIAIISLLLAFSFKEMVDVAIIYSAGYILMGSFLIYGWIVKLDKKYMPYTYWLASILFFALLLYSNLEVGYVILVVVIVPISYYISKFAFIILHKPFKPKI